MKSPVCTLGKKHKWVWVNDVKITNQTMNARGATMKISLRGVFKCECGGVRHGYARGGL